jgi:NAD(P)-dependent dehydrogenase (short-subunit alcohol dehydrogenase family)
LASHGCNVIIADIDKEAADCTSHEIIKMGLKSRAFKIDITKSEEVLRIKHEVLKEFGSLDILVNNAGIISVSNFGSDALLESMVEVNLLGTILVRY